MLKLECDCGQRGYFEYLFSDDKDNIAISLDIDTLNLKYDEDEGLVIECPNCKNIHHIIRIT